MNDKTVTKNAGLNILKSISRIVFPIITFPYVTRILLTDNIGKINYAQSIVSYFSLIASLGISTYAIRECSKVKTNKAELEKKANEIFSINLVSTTIAFLLMFLMVYNIEKFEDYSWLITIYSINIVFSTLGCEWINNVMEDFRYITLRTILFQILSFILMIVFVKDTNDFIKYVIITVLASSGANLINIFHRRKYCKIKLTVHLNAKRHLKPIILLFSILLAQTVYVNSDMTMLGWFKGDYHVGIYSVAVKLYTTINTLVGSIAAVIIPGLTYCFENKDYKNVNSLLSYSAKLMITVGIPCLVGINCIASEIIILISGEAYIEAVIPLHILMIASFFSYIVSFFSNMILVPSGKEKIALKASVTSAIVNVLLNIIFIPILGIIAAACTTVISEIVSLFIVTRKIDKTIKMPQLVNICKSVVPGGMIILLISVVVRKVTSNNILIAVSTITFSVIFYVLSQIMLKNEIFQGLLEKR